jgi:molybdate/tungstate transport system substrate-binding protein
LIYSKVNIFMKHDAYRDVIMNMKVIVTVAVVIALIIGFLAGYEYNSLTTPVPVKVGVTVIAAGSLGYALREVGQNWTVLYPDHPTLPDGGIYSGSVGDARDIAAGQKYDVFASAAADVIPMILSPTYASWMIVFATNQIAILYLPNSTAKLTVENVTYSVTQINSTNWWMFITAPGVTIGVSNGSTDPDGFQSIQAMKLAGVYLLQTDNVAYNDWFHNVLGFPLNDSNAIFDQIWKNKFTSGQLKPVGVETSLDSAIATGTPCYALSYRSLAKSDGLGYVQLPWQVNLGSINSTAVSYYSQVNSSGAPILLSGSPAQASNPAGPIFYAVTIPNTAPNPTMGLDYITLLLSQIGQQVLQNTYFTPISVPYAVPFSSGVSIPAQLLPFTESLPSYLQTGSGYTAIMGPSA